MFTMSAISNKLAVISLKLRLFLIHNAACNAIRPAIAEPPLESIKEILKLGYFL